MRARSLNTGFINPDLMESLMHYRLRIERSFYENL
jgi:hypothetical protein